MAIKNVCDENKKQERLSRIYKIKYNASAIIVEYNTADDLIIKVLESGEYIKTRYSHLEKGEVVPKFVPHIFGVGFIGNASTIDYFSPKKNGGYKNKRSYIVWKGMLERCYCDEYLKKHPTYVGCEVCDEWKSYETFEKWYNENYYEIEEYRIDLDKDIVKKGNKIYSPQTCVFVPQNINVLFNKNKKFRNKLPLGVSRQGNRFKSQCSIYGKKVHLGLYGTVEEAFYSYKTYKENIIKEIAEEYKDRIPNKLYLAMYNYQVEITD